MRRRTRKEIQIRDSWRVLQTLLLDMSGGDESAAGAVLDVLFDFDAFLQSENRKFNLTSIRDARTAVIKHFVDSLLPLQLFDIIPNEKSSVADVGSGAGFPGLPLAAVRPAVYWTLVDATKKRCNFLTKAVEQLGLRNTVVLWTRSEDLGRHPQHRERYDAAVARAVAPLPVLLELATPLLRVGGRLFAWKGPGIETEIETSAPALQALGCGIETVHRYTLPELQEPRTLAVIVKTAPTPDKYPRPAGAPSRRPLSRL
ncbi:MAG: 16S rRNA (guanine(527)-N(7))-methyltransferase RsmG [Candidatus Sumerlaeia bacterium]